MSEENDRCNDTWAVLAYLVAKHGPISFTQTDFEEALSPYHDNHIMEVSVDPNGTFVARFVAESYEGA